MRFYQHIIAIFLFFFLFGIKPLAAEENGKLKSWLEESGFENIQISVADDMLILSYENRIFRNEADGIAYLLQNMPIPEVDIILFLPKYLNISMLQVEVSVISLRQYRKGEIESEDFVSKIKFNLNTDNCKQKNNLSNPSYFKIDVLLEPKLSMQLGNYDRPIQVLAELAPTLQMQLNKGLLLNAELLIPVYNNLRNMEDASIRAGILSLSQNFRLPDDFFVTATAGIFSYDRLGLDVKTKKYFLKGRLGVFTQMGYSTWTEIANKLDNRYFDKDNYFVGRIGAEYRYAKYDLLISTSYGSFLYQDKGWRFDVFRQFDELIIGFVGIYTSEDYNAGFYLSVPLFPKKYTKINRVRVRPSHYFNWGYRFKGQTYAGKNYSTGKNILHKTREFNPDFIKNQLILLLK